MSSPHEIATLREIMFRDGIRAALIHLNGLTTHRFSALYKFSGDTLSNLYFFDRFNPELLSSPEIPLAASYCVFVRDSGRLFATDSALEDARCAGHPKQRELQAYCGVPLVDDSGRMFGTVCHFDFQPMSIQERHVSLMESLAAMLQNQLRI